MIRLSTERGAIQVDHGVYTRIAGVAASNCFGVKGMAHRSMTDGLVHILRREVLNKGVRVSFHDDKSISEAPSLTKYAMSSPNPPAPRSKQSMSTSIP